MTVHREGNGFFTEDAEYVVRHTHSGWAVYRGDGSYAEFLGEAEAMEAAQNLASGEASDKDYEWQD